VDEKQHHPIQTIKHLLDPIEGGGDHQDGPRNRKPVEIIPFVAVIAAIELFDLLLTSRLQFALADDTSYSVINHYISIGANILFATLLTLAIGTAIITRGKTPRFALPMMLIYLSVASINVLINLATLILAPGMSQTSQLGLTLDLGLAFLSVTLNFSLWYQIADAELRGGAFDFPPNGAHPESPPNWFDYFALSFFANSTFGPTLENIRTRIPKAMMMFQVSLSLVILVLLVARIIKAE